MRRAIMILAIVYLMVLVAIGLLVRFDSGSWWPTTAFLFGPRWVVALPLLILVPMTIAYRARMTFVYPLHCVVILFPILGFQIDLSGSPAGSADSTIRLMTCNLGGGNVRQDDLVHLVNGQKVQVLMLQECPAPVASAVFGELGWDHRQEGNMAIGSCWKLGQCEVLARHPEANFRAVAAFSCPIDWRTDPAKPGQGTIRSRTLARIVCVHLPTFRPALQRAREWKRDAASAITRRTELYGEVTEQLVVAMRRWQGPTIVGGDFNVPIESGCYQRYWSNYQNAHSCAGSGLGYTKFTRYHGTRIDHLLADERWTFETACVGPSLGGDHRPVIADVRWKRES